MDGSDFSGLRKTWIFDLDGTLVRHNGYKDGREELLPGVREFFLGIPDGDAVIILTARKNEHKAATEDFLARNGLRFDHVVYDLPTGERILLNDRKPDGIPTAYSHNLDRDEGLAGLLGLWGQV